MTRVGAVVCLLLLAATGYAAEPAEDHPLVPLLQYAEQRLQQIDDTVKDYTCTLVERERIDGRLQSHQHMFVKLRHQQVRDGVVVVPFSIYLRYLGPAEVQGREVIYVHGRNNGQLIVRRGGPRFEYITLAVDPDGDLAMRDNRYPITEVGIRNLLRRLIEVGREELQHREIDVKYFAGAKVNDRACTAIRIAHAVRRDHFRYHVARVFVDDELQVPIRFESYDWPEEEGGEPRLVEEYTFLDLKLNVGLTDWDFDHQNESYGFRKNFVP